MGKKRNYHPLVVDDFSSGVKYYSEFSISLSSRFREAFRIKLRSVSEFSESYGIYQDNLRVAKLDRFPYLIAFTETESTVSIIGLFHSASDPESWLSRLE